MTKRVLGFSRQHPWIFWWSAIFSTGFWLAMVFGFLSDVEFWLQGFEAEKLLSREGANVALALWALCTVATGFVLVFVVLAIVGWVSERLGRVRIRTGYS